MIQLLFLLLLMAMNVELKTKSYVKGVKIRKQRTGTQTHSIAHLNKIGFDNSKLLLLLLLLLNLLLIPSSTGKTVLFFFLTYLTIERSQQIALTEYQMPVCVYCVCMYVCIYASRTLCVRGCGCVCENYCTCLYLTDWFPFFLFLFWWYGGDGGGEDDGGGGGGGGSGVVTIAAAAVAATTVRLAGWVDVLFLL